MRVGTSPSWSYGGFEGLLGLAFVSSHTYPLTAGKVPYTGPVTAAWGEGVWSAGHDEVTASGGWFRLLGRVHRVPGWINKKAKEPAKYGWCRLLILISANTPGGFSNEFLGKGLANKIRIKRWSRQSSSASAVPLVICQLLFFHCLNLSQGLFLSHSGSRRLTNSLGHKQSIRSDRALVRVLAAKGAAPGQEGFDF